MNLELEFEIMAELVFVMYLLWVSWQDCKEMLVVRYAHVLGFCAVLMLAFARRNVIMSSPLTYVGGVGSVTVMQVIAYKCRCYGLADVLVFLLCGLFLLFKKGTELYLTAYAVMFASAVNLLFFVQLLKKNLKGLYLCQPVAYIPYICVAFSLTNVVF